jgi:hypothetical protein
MATAKQRAIQRSAAGLQGSEKGKRSHRVRDTFSNETEEAKRAKYDWQRWLIALDRDMAERPGLWWKWVKTIKKKKK